MTELLRLAAPVSAVVIALAVVSVASAVTEFRVAGTQIYCGVAEAFEVPSSFRAPLLCWRGTNGFVVSLSASGRVRTHWNPNDRQLNQFAVRKLPLGQDYWSTKSNFGLGPGPESGVLYRCFSRVGGLTCINRDGHGFWLGPKGGFSRYEQPRA